MISFRSIFASVPLASTKSKCGGPELAELAHTHSHFPYVLLNVAEGGLADKRQGWEWSWQVGHKVGPGSAGNLTTDTLQAADQGMACGESRQ